MRDLEAQFCKEFKALVIEGKEIILPLSPLQAWAVLCFIQLALRHPHINEEVSPCARLARITAEEIQAQVATTPALAKVAARGWDPSCDVPMEQG